MIVVMLVVDSLRADAPSYAGGAAHTQALDELAAEGTTFPHLAVSGSWTVPSLTAIATGAFPHRVGICRWRHRFPLRRPTLMSAFAAAGFEVHVMAHNPRWIFGSCGHRGVTGDSQEPAEVVDALRGPRGRDRFVLLHHWWTHLPYINKKLPASGWKKACEYALESISRHPGRMVPKFRRNYLATVEYFSRELLGRYLDAAGAGGEDVLVVVTGDHGENWGESLPRGRRVEHIFDLHGRWLRDATTRVPLLLWGKGHAGAIPAGAALQGTVRGVDLAPTVCELAGIPWPGPLPLDEGPRVVDHGIGPEGQGLVLDGRSIAGAVLGGQDLAEGDTLTVSTHNTHQPDTYPDEGRVVFRTLGLRRSLGWNVWDGVSQSRTTVAENLDGETDPDDPDVWQLLEDEWAGAVDPGPGLPLEAFPRHKGEREEGDFDAEPAAHVSPGPADTAPAEDPQGSEAILRKMRMLGYMD